MYVDIQFLFIKKKKYSTCEKPEDTRHAHFLPALTRVVGHPRRHARPRPSSSPETRPGFGPDQIVFPPLSEKAF